MDGTVGQHDACTATATVRQSVVRLLVGRVRTGRAGGDDVGRAAAGGLGAAREKPSGGQRDAGGEHGCCPARSHIPSPGVVVVVVVPPAGGGVVGDGWVVVPCGVAGGLAPGSPPVVLCWGPLGPGSVVCCGGAVPVSRGWAPGSAGGGLSWGLGSCGPDVRIVL